MGVSGNVKMRRKGSNTSLTFNNKMFLFMIPALAFFLIFWIYPVLQLFYYSLTNFNGINYDFDFVGLKNYAKVFDNGTVINSLKITIIYAAVTVILSNIIGLAIAIMLNEKIRMKGFYRTAAFFPALFSAIVVGFIWSYVYMPTNGMIASLVSLLGGDGAKFNPLGDFKMALFAIAIVEVWKGFGSTMIIYLAGLQTVSDSVLEAGRIAGCNGWQLPGPGKSTKTLMFQIYEIAFTDQKMGRASAFSVVAFIFIIVVTMLMLVFMNKREVEI